MPYDLGLLWGFGEEGEADLPSGRVWAKIIEIIEGLRFQGLVGGRIPGDFNGISYLEAGMSILYVNSEDPSEGLNDWPCERMVVVFQVESKGPFRQTHLFFHLRPARLPFKMWEGGNTKIRERCVKIKIDFGGGAYPWYRNQISVHCLYNPALANRPGVDWCRAVG